MDGSLMVPAATGSHDLISVVMTAAVTPVDAVRACVDDSMARAAVLDLLGRAADGAALTEDEETLLFRGLYALAAGRETRACAPLLRLLCAPGERVELLLGDAVTSDMRRIVASVFDGDAETLLNTAVVPMADEWVRSALIDATTILTIAGRISRARMAEFLRRFDDERLAKDEDFAWVSWIEAVGRLGLTDLAPNVHAALTDGRLPLPTLGVAPITAEEFAEDLALAARAGDDPAPFREFGLGLVDDLELEMAWIVHAETERLKPRPVPARSAWQPQVNPLRDIGRNDQCPCGSGRKYKKCCLNH